MKKQEVFIFLLIISFFCQGAVCTMAENTVQTEDPSGRVLAKELIQDMVTSYINYTIPAFTDKLSEDFYPSRMEFVSDAGNSFYRKDVISLIFSVETVNINGQELSAAFKWQKKVRDKDTGVLEIVKGTAAFVFEEKEGIWKLLKVSGDNPF